MGGRDAEAQAWVQCSTARGALGPTCPAPTEGRVWGRGRGGGGSGGRANPTRLVCQPPGPPLPLPGTWGKSEKLLLPGPSPSAPDIPFSPQSAAAPPGGRPSLTVQQGIRARRAGSLLQAGPLEFPLSSAAPPLGGRWGGQRGGVVH